MANNVNAWTGLSQATSDLPQLAMGMYKLRRDEEDKDMALAIARDRYNLEREAKADTAAYHQGMLEKANASIPTHKQTMDPNMILQSKVAAKQAYGDQGLKAWEPLYGAIDDIVSSNPKSTKADAYKAALSSWPSIREQMISQLEKDLTSEKLDPIKKQRLEKVYDAVVYDKTGENVLGNGVFSETARSIKMEEDNTKAALIAARGEAKGKWSEPYQIGGSWVQKNEETGQIHQVVNRLPQDRTDDKEDKKLKQEKNAKIAALKNFIAEEEKNRKAWETSYGKLTKKDKDAKPPQGESMNYWQKHEDALSRFDSNIDNAKRQLIALENDQVRPSDITVGGVGMSTGRKKIGTSNGKPVYDNGDGTWTVGD